ncbi:hypothetical protein M8818_002274 [Zalaria obscura]|uniref:Uncharacterized protein n=1 Tax=Zalaria obscura TaxID=2024903 RepID=A0ACC3SI69_9PEZI
MGGATLLSMDEQIQHVATIINSRAIEKSGRYLVAIAGAPGSGKTTVATALAQKLNSMQSDASAQISPRAVSISMDGFHLPRSVLDTMPDVKKAYARRGAPWTFDAPASLAFVRRLSAWASKKSSAPVIPEENIYAPSFDHAIKDPVPDGIVILPSVSIVILEGNYLLLDEPPWSEIGPLVDLRIFVQVDLDEARARVAKRHVAAGIEPTLDDALRRVDVNDYINGQLVQRRSVEMDLVIESIPIR